MNCIRRPLRGTTNRGTTGTISENPAEQGTTGNKGKSLENVVFSRLLWLTTTKLLFSERATAQPSQRFGIPVFVKHDIEILK